MAGVALGRQRPELQHQLVAVRADQRDAALQLGLADLGDLVEHRGGQHVAVGDQRHVLAQRRRGSRSPPARPRRTPTRPPPGKPCRPAVAAPRPGRSGRPAARRRRWPGASPRPRGSAGPPARAPRAPAPDLQQGVALLEHPVVVGPHPGVPRRAQHQQVVEEPAALGRVALDEGQVLGGEQHAAQDAEHLPGPRHRRPVDPRPVGLAGGDLDLDAAATGRRATTWPRTTARSAPSRTSGASWATRCEPRVDR